MSHTSTLTAVFLGKVRFSLANLSETDDSAEWSLPDQLVFSTVSALLRVAALHPEHSDTATSAIVDFVGDVDAKLLATAGE